MDMPTPELNLPVLTMHMCSECELNECNISMSVLSIDQDSSHSLMRKAHSTQTDMTACVYATNDNTGLLSRRVLLRVSLQ